MSYPWQKIGPKDEAVVRQGQQISDLDLRNLTVLYQPIIGSPAYSLYMTLFAELSDGPSGPVSLLHAELLSLCNMGIPEFYQARVRLEGIGLLRAFVEKEPERRYIYELQAPLSSKAFFEDDMMRLLLLDIVGERKYRQLLDRFSQPKNDPSAAEEEITLSFLDVYHFSPDQFKTSETKVPEGSRLVEKEAGKSGMVTDKTFDFSFFYQCLNQQFIQRQSITKSMENLILALHTFYGTNEVDMANFVLQAADIESGKVNSEDLQKIMMSHYQQPSHSRKQVTDKIAFSIQEAKEKENGRGRQLREKGFKEQEIQLIRACEYLTPLQFIQDIKKQKGGMVTANEKYTLNELLKQTDITASVLNMLIHYVLIEQGNGTLNKDLTLTIANDWLQHRITTPEEAILKVRQFIGERKARAEKRVQRSENTRQNRATYTRKVEKLPDWAKEDRSNSPEEMLPEDVQQKINERIKKLKSTREAGDS